MAIVTWACSKRRPCLASLSMWGVIPRIEDPDRITVHVIDGDQHDVEAFARAALGGDQHRYRRGDQECESEVADYAGRAAWNGIGHGEETCKREGEITNSIARAGWAATGVKRRMWFDRLGIVRAGV